MSKRKRRKVAVKKGKRKEKKSPLQLFKEDVMKSFTDHHWYLECSGYLNTVKGHNRTKKFTIKLKPFTIYRRLLVIYSRGKEIRKYFKTLGAEKRVVELAEFGKYEEYMLKKLLKRLKVTDIKKLLARHFPDQKFKGGKVHIIEEVISRYFGRDTALEKREMEKENIEDVLEMQELNSIYLCNILVPREIIIQIFRFIKYDKDLLFDIGKICKMFYFTILSSWNTLLVKNKKVYQTSLLVLSNVRNIIMSVRNEKEVFRNEEMNHIFKNLNPNKITKIALRMDIYSYVKTLGFICRTKQKTSLVNVKILQYFQIGGMSRKKNKDAMDGNWGRIRLIKVFPQLEEIYNPIRFEILDGCLNVTRMRVNLRATSVRYNSYPLLRKLLEGKKLVDEKKEYEYNEDEDDEEEDDNHEEYLKYIFSRLKSLEILIGWCNTHNSIFFKNFGKISLLCENLVNYLIDYGKREFVVPLEDLKKDRLCFSKHIGQLSSLEEFILIESSIKYPNRLDQVYHRDPDNYPLVISRFPIPELPNLKRVKILRSAPNKNQVGLENGVSVEDLNTLLKIRSLEVLYLLVLDQEKSEDNVQRFSTLDTLKENFLRFKDLQIEIIRVKRYEIINDLPEIEETNFKSYLVLKKKMTISLILNTREISEVKHTSYQKIEDFGLIYMMIEHLPRIFKEIRIRRAVFFREEYYFKGSFIVCNTKWTKHFLKKIKESKYKVNIAKVKSKSSQKTFKKFKFELNSKEIEEEEENKALEDE